MWKEKYRIGIELVDEQHKELFKRLSDFIEVIQNEKDWDEKLEQVNKTMLFMQEYVIFYFNDEEDYMAKVNYAEIENHVSTHTLFREWIGDCKWKLLFRASEHEYSTYSFHDYCNDQNPTLVVIKSTGGWIFGGYTTNNWEGTGIC